MVGLSYMSTFGKWAGRCPNGVESSKRRAQPRGPRYLTQEPTLLHPTKTQRGPTAIDGLVQIHCGLKLNYYHLLWDSHLWTGSPIYIALALSRFFLGSRMGP